MLSSKLIFVSLILFFLPFLSYASPQEPCPARKDQPLRYATVFDGPPEELASLIPDKGGEHAGYWELGYVYEAGRAVHINCEYADKRTTIAKLSTRVEKCYYRINKQKTLSIACE